jgi:hypothetical protein
VGKTKGKWLEEEKEKPNSGTGEQQKEANQPVH